MTFRYDPVVFDLDGTILDSAPTIVHALKEACARVGVAVPEGADLHSCVGPPFEIALPAALGSGIDVDAVIATYREIYRPLAEERTLPMPGVADVLKDLSKHGVAMAIATYKPRDLAQALLRSTGLGDFFQLCAGRLPPDDRRTKAEILRDVLEELSPHRGTPVYIGDHEEDRRAAATLSIDFIAYGDGLSWADIAPRLRQVTGR